jgi:hypothetical protein
LRCSVFQSESALGDPGDVKEQSPAFAPCVLCRLIASSSSVAATVAPSVRIVPATAKYATELANANVNVYTLMKLLGKRASGSYVRRSNCRRCQLARAKERSARSGSATMSDSPT